MSITRTNNPDRSAKYVSPGNSGPEEIHSSVMDVHSSILAVHGRTFHFATRFLSPPIRYSVITLYAFFRTIDDLVDIPDVSRQPEDILAELNSWRAWFISDFATLAPRKQLGENLAAILRKKPVPISIFLDFLDGMVWDLQKQEIHDFDDLYKYCYRIASTVGLAMAHILGATSPQALAAAEYLGIAMQLTNILRDVGEDLNAHRIYLPKDELARFGCPKDRLLELYQAQKGPDEAFESLMCYQIARAHEYYAQGLAGVWLLPSSCRLAILTAGRLYRRILHIITRRHYDVLRKRASTSSGEKVWEAGIALLLDRLWRVGETNMVRNGERI